MVDKNQGSVKSHSVQKNEPVRNLWVKLKFPKEEGFLQKKDNNHHHHQMMIMKNDTERVCHVCDKVFSSGKALGGHMRIHYQQAKFRDLLFSKKKKLIEFDKQNPHDDHQVSSSEELKSKSNIDFDTKMDNKPVCGICGRDFPSMKSLFGHMRCHPDRGWRGLQPPQSGNSSFSSSSSSLSDAELSSDIKGHMEIGFDYEGEKGIVDLVESLGGGWVVTARRGRKAAGVGSTSEASSSEEDELLHNAARDLMMLSRDLTTRNERKILDTESVSKCMSKRKIGEDVENNVFIGESDKIKNKKKIRKKVMKLCDLDQMDDQNGATPPNRMVGAAAGDKYRCTSCDKSFLTYQALGGHMSSHNKLHRVVIQNTMTAELGDRVEEREKEGVYLSTDGPLSQVVSPSDGSETRRRGLGFDLNEKLPSEDEVGFDFEIYKNTW